MEIKDLIVDDRERGIFRYHRSSMSSSEVLELEQERIFEKCWLYLGHESEVEKPGDFRRRTVAGRPLFFVRSSDGDVRVFFNTCRHRGTTICRRDEGNAEVFQCFYHAWTYNDKGELIGVPDEAGYSPGFDKREMGLQSPPRVESYRGLYFVSFNPEIEELGTYLAGAKEYIDLMADQTETGMRVVQGSNKYSTKANWKLLVENSIDSYHLIPTHKTYLDYIASLGTDVTRQERRWSQSLALGNGHAVMQFVPVYGRPIARWAPLYGEGATEEMAQTRARLVERFGEERAWQIADTGRNLLIYPNLIINDIMAVTVRVFWPVAPDRMEVTAWELVPREESGAVLERRLDSFLTFLGPGGFATPDDIEAMESCQAGFQAKEVEWSDISRGMHLEAPESHHELQLRAFWRRWHGDLLGQEKQDTGDRVRINPQVPASL